MASIIDVARKAGVGTSTVSRVINGNGYVSKESKEKVLEAIKETNFIPNVTAQSLKSAKTNIVALFVPTISHPFFSLIADYIEEELYKLNMRLIIVNSQSSKDKEEQLLKMINQNQVDGIIFITHYVYDNIDSSLPIVTIDRHLGKDIPCITSNNYDLTMEALEYLYGKGCKKIGFIGGKPRVASEVERRMDAYNDFTSKHHLNKYISFEIFNYGEELYWAKQFLEKYSDLDAIFASGDIMANTIYQVAHSKNIDVPNKLKIISYDGVMDNIVLHPIFSSCKQNIPLMAHEAVFQLVKRIKNEKVKHLIIVSGTLVLGETA